MNSMISLIINKGFKYLLPSCFRELGFLESIMYEFFTAKNGRPVKGDYSPSSDTL